MSDTPNASPASGGLNICVIGSTYPRSQDDYAVPWLRESVNRLVARGHAVTVLAPSYQGLGNHTIDGVPVHRFRYGPRRWEKLTHEQGAPNRIRSNPLLQLLGVPYVIMGSLAAAVLATRRRFDVIHVHWPFPHGLIASTARLFGGAPVVMNCHGAEFALARHKAWVRPLLRRALRSADLLIGNSSHTAVEIRALSGRDARVIPYGSTVRAKPTPMPRHDVAHILFTGRLIQRKGVKHLIRAMPQILAKRPAVLEITGDGDQMGELRGLTRSLGLEHAVEFHGFVSNQRLDELYADCDVYVNPSVIDDRGDTEGLGVGPIEALAHGRPVVASAVGGIPDVVKHRVTGMLVPEKDESALAGAIMELLDDPVRAEALAGAGLEFVRRQFDWDLITDALEDAYHHAIETYRARHVASTIVPTELPPRHG
jgi:glycosyltransferase involved in cell wall biosynthesis